MRRKGELSSGQVNRLYPHQVALPPLNDRERYDRWELIQVFIQEQGVSISPRGFSVIHGDGWWVVHCFADRAEAEMFKAVFKGVWCPASERGGGRRWWRWEPKELP
jgi:hypothetical protein